MLSKNYKVEEVLLNEIKLLPEYLHENLYKILGVIISMIPKVGKNLVETLNKCKEIVTGFKKFHEQKENKANTANQLVDFITDIENREGSIFEDDIVSTLIEKIINNKKNGEENILILDDLDRIDPEHIFRILNVFAAHFDRRNTTVRNKFGFDKILLVCDIENIRSIFKAKYGLNTDFNGYIDKFYSYEVFIYSYRKAIEDYALNKIKQAVWVYKDGSRMSRNEADQKRNVFFSQPIFFIDILDMLFDNNEIDLRNLSKWDNLLIPYDDYMVFRNNSGLELRKYPILFYIKLLCKIKGSPECLKHTLNNIVNTTINKGKLHSYISDLIYIILILEHKQKANSNAYYNLNELPIRLDIDANGKHTITHLHSQSLYFSGNHLILAISECINLLISEDLL